MTVLRALVRASHPIPALVVVGAAVALAGAFGAGPRRMLLVALAIGAGQLTVGWSNDLIDSGRDRAVGRSDKPAATGALPLPVLRRGLGLALGLTALASAALGMVAGALHLVALVGAWSYNLGLKSRAVSPLPYALSFGVLPQIGAQAAAQEWAPLWLSATAALVGVAANLLNCMPDLAEDAATGLRGLPHRLGVRGTRWAAAVVLLCGVAVAVVGSALPRTLLVVVLVLVAGALGVVARGRGQAPFHALAVLALVLLVVIGGRLAG